MQEKFSHPGENGTLTKGRAVLLAILGIVLHLLFQLIPVPQPWGMSLQFFLAAVAGVLAVGGLAKSASRQILATGVPAWNPAVGYALAGAVVMQLPPILLNRGLFSAEINRQSAQILGLVPGETGTRLAVIIGSVIFAAVAEEILYRGLLYKGLRSFFSRDMTRQQAVNSAILLSSVLFAMLHPGTPLLWLIQTVGAAFWAWSYEKTGSLLVSVFSHSLANAWVFFTLLHGPYRAVEGNGFTLLMLILSPFVAAALTYVLGRWLLSSKIKGVRL